MDESTQLLVKRFRIIFAKTEVMRFTGHLDLFRTWERTLRRADIPLAYSHGFNPRPKMTLASALPLGFTSECEIIDIWLKEEQDLQHITMEITRALPPGIRINEIIGIDEHAPKPQSLLESAIYHVTIPNNRRIDSRDLQKRIDQLLHSEEIIRIRKGKKYNLRKLIIDLKIASSEKMENPIINMHLYAREGATGRPDEVIDELGINPLDCFYHRQRLIFHT